MVANVSGNYAVNPYAYNNAAVGATYSTNLNSNTSYLAQTGQDTVSFSGNYEQQKTESKGKKALKTGLIIGGIALAAVTIAAAVRGKKINGEGAKLLQNLKTGFRSIFTKAGRAEYADIAHKVTDKLDDAIEKLPLFDGKTTKPGVYRDSAGNKVIVDKYGTGIVDFGNDKFLVTKGTVQKLYDGAEFVADEATTALSVVTKPTSMELAKAATKADEATTALATVAESAKATTELATTTSTGLAKSTAKVADASTKAAQAINIPPSEACAEVAQTMTEAKNLIKVLEQNPSDRSTYCKILKLVHPDNATKYAGSVGASVEKDFSHIAAMANTIYKAA